MRPKFLKPNDYAPLFFIGAFFMALLAAGTLALAQQSSQHTKESQCNTISNIVEQLHALPAELRNQLHIRVLDEEQTSRWRDAYNSLPPQSKIRMDQLAFIRRDGNQFVVLIFEIDGCVVNAVKLNLETHFLVLRDSGLERGKVI